MEEFCLVLQASIKLRLEIELIQVRNERHFQSTIRKPRVNRLEM